jgi:peptide deformylase
MPVRPILTWPDARLATPCPPEGTVTEELRVLAADLLETMYAAPGRGLAAPQVGARARLFVMDVTWKEGAATPRACLDPAILWRAEETAVFREACLSLPGLVTEIARPVAIRLAWTDLSGDRQEAELAGLEAVCAQHELDHLDGLVTLDRLAPEARADAEAAYAAAGVKARAEACAEARTEAPAEACAEADSAIAAETRAGGTGALRRAWPGPGP